ncbi:hypothetical protein A0H81_03864 [Grifola frondosa]|uniref:Uncharacterized protein n=1 Tax=Grifola frondosa TaxID=5627 RepID=A0A1C7MQD5_GRIFR|nr:hypothetical protein A0H81_03864 [Grifola frondosa]
MSNQSQATVFFADDQDYSSVTYEPENLWQHSSVSGAGVFDGTLSSGTTNATATFTFTGSVVRVLGVIVTAANESWPLPAIGFQLDGTAPSLYQPPAYTVTPNGQLQLQEQVAVYTSPQLADGQHILKIGVVEGTLDYPFVLDAFEYVPSSNAAATASQQVATTTIVASGATGAAGNSSKSSGAPVGAIVGGVIGGVAILVCAAIAVYFLCFRRRHGQTYFYAAARAGTYSTKVSSQASSVMKSADQSLEIKATPTPYMLPVSPSVVPESTAGAESSYNPPVTIPQPVYAPSQLGGAPTSDMGGSSTSGSSRQTRSMYAVNAMSQLQSSPNQPMSKAAQAGLLSVPQPTTYHADSGVRFTASAEPSSSGVHAVTDVPPTYSEN